MSHRLYHNIPAAALLLALNLVGAVAAEAPKSAPVTVPETTPAGKPIDSKTATPAFDPQAYACTQVVQALQQGGDPARTILLWAHGYFSAAYSADEVGPLNTEMSTQLYTGLNDYCQKHPSLNLARAVDALSSE